MKLPDTKDGGDDPYVIFLKQCLDSEQNLGDTHQPEVLKKQLRKLDFYPSPSFSSITEKKRHMPLFHHQNKVKVTSSFIFICNYQNCNKRFGRQPSLSRHQTKENHTARDVLT